MVNLYLSTIYCSKESDELSDSDEPYVLVVAVDFSTTVSIGPLSVPLPSLDVILYGPFVDMDAGETHAAPGIAQSFWPVAGATPAPTSASSAVFIVAMMENDDGDPEVLRTIVKSTAAGSLVVSAGLAQPQQIAALIRDVNSA